MSAKSYRRRAARVVRKTLDLDFVPAQKLARGLLGVGSYKTDLELYELAEGRAGFASPCGDPQHCGAELVFRGPNGSFTRNELRAVVEELARKPAHPRSQKS
jgi:hypothetical protein